MRPDPHAHIPCPINSFGLEQLIVQGLWDTRNINEKIFFDLAHINYYKRLIIFQSVLYVESNVPINSLSINFSKEENLY